LDQFIGGWYHHGWCPADKCLVTCNSIIKLSDSVYVRLPYVSFFYDG
jgi:hypothetical protein